MLRPARLAQSARLSDLSRQGPYAHLGCILAGPKVKWQSDGGVEQVHDVTCELLLAGHDHFDRASFLRTLR
jgi:hypothetical protein